MKQVRIVGDRFGIAIVSGDKLEFAPHTYDEYLLSCIISGYEKLSLDGRAYQASKGATTLLNPGQVLSSNGSNASLNLYLDPDYFEKEGLSEKPVYIEKKVVKDDQLFDKFLWIKLYILSENDINFIEETVIQIISIVIERYTNAMFNLKLKPYDWRIKRMKEILLSEQEENGLMKRIAAEIGMHRCYLTRLFNAATGHSPIRWRRIKKLESGRSMLKNGLAVKHAALDAGFSDQPHFSRLFRRAYGLSPSQFAREYSVSRSAR